MNDGTFFDDLMLDVKQHFVIGADCIFTPLDLVNVSSRCTQDMLLPGGSLVIVQCPRMMGRMAENLVIMNVDENEDEDEDVDFCRVLEHSPETFMCELRNIPGQWHHRDRLVAIARTLYKPVCKKGRGRYVYIASPIDGEGDMLGGYAGQCTQVSGGDDKAAHMKRSELNTVYKGIAKEDVTAVTRQTIVDLQVRGGGVKLERFSVSTLPL